MKKELVEALQTRDKDTLISFFFGDHEFYFTYPDISTHLDSEIWLGEYLYHLLIKKKITNEQLLFALNMRDASNKSWLHHIIARKTHSARAVINFLTKLHHDKVIYPDELLNILFSRDKEGFSFVMLMAKEHAADTKELLLLIDALLDLMKDESTIDIDLLLYSYFQIVVDSENFFHAIAKDCAVMSFCLDMLKNWFRDSKLSADHIITLLLLKNHEDKTVIDLILQETTLTNLYKIFDMLTIIGKHDRTTLPQILAWLETGTFDPLKNLFRKAPEGFAVSDRLSRQKTSENLKIDERMANEAERFQVINSFLKWIIHQEEMQPTIFRIFLPRISSIYFNNAAILWPGLDLEVYNKTLNFLKNSGTIELNLARTLTLLSTLELTAQYGGTDAFICLLDILRLMLITAESKIEYINRLLYCSQSEWTSHHIIARSADEKANIEFLKFTFDNVAALDAYYRQEVRDLRNVNMNLWYENLVISKEPHPHYLQLLIQNHSLKALTIFIEYGFATNRLNQPAVVKQVLLTLTDEDLVKVEPELIDLREITIKLLECLLSYALDSEELACLYMLAKRPGYIGGAAKYLLFTRLAHDSIAADYFEQSLASGYVLAELKKSVGELTARFPSTKVFQKLCAKLGTAEEFIKTLTKYHVLKALSDDEYLILLEKHPRAADLTISFCIAKFTNDRSKPTAKKKLLDISKRFFDKLSIEQHVLLVTIYFNFAKFSSPTDYVCFYHALKHMHLVKQQHYVGELPDYEYMTGYPIMAELLAWESAHPSLQSLLHQLRDVIINDLHRDKIELNNTLFSLCQNITKLSKTHDHNAIAFIERYISQKPTTLVSSIFFADKDLVKILRKFIDTINKTAKIQFNQILENQLSSANK